MKQTSSEIGISTCSVREGVAEVGRVGGDAGAEGVERGCNVDGLVIGRGMDGGRVKCDGGVSESGADGVGFCLSDYNAVGGGVGDGFGYAYGERMERHFEVREEGLELLSLLLLLR